ncbi:MAG TPA: TonB-dependent receptor [Flavitalea sp.]|nr:TonB-dependent receptor [Flavitalea sp.]
MNGWYRVAVTLLLFFLVHNGKSQEPSTQPRIRNSLSGRILDAATNLPLAGASVYIPDQKRGIVCDNSGHYRLANLGSGKHLIEISHVGYATTTEYIDVNGDVTRDFYLAFSLLENNEVVITGVNTATQLRRSPAPVSVIRHAELVRTVSTNLFDAIARKPGITQLSTGPAVSKPFIRGLGYNRILVINDGVRQEGQQWGDEHGVEIDEYSVSKVEIMKGPASLMYGSDALAGVINIITNVPVAEGTIKGSVISNYQTNNRMRGIGGNIGGNNNGFNWNAFGSYKAAGDYTNRYDGRVYNSKFIEKNLGGYIGYNGRWGFTHLLASNFNQHPGLVEGERNSNGEFIKRVSGGGTAILSSDDFNYVNPAIPFQHINHFKIATDNSFKISGGTITLNIGYQQNKRKEFGNIEQPESYGLFFDLRSLTYNLAYHFAEKNGWRTTAGFTGMRQTNRNRGEEMLIPEYVLNDAGGFVFSQKSADQLTVSGGLRFDTRHIHADEFEENNQLKFRALRKNFSNVSGSLGITYAVSPKVTVKFNAAKGFRAPSIPELASNGAHEGTNRYEYGNSSLKSETSMQFDGAIEANTEHISFSAAVFTNSINNFIFYRKLLTASGSDSLVNSGGNPIPAYRFSQDKALLIGGEFTVDIHPHPFDWLHFENSFSTVSGRFNQNTGGTKNLPLIPAPRLLSELRAVLFEKGKTLRNVTIKMEVEKTFSQDHPFTAYGTESATPGYTLLNSGISTDVYSKKNMLFTFYISAMNLGDVAYQNHLSRLKYFAENPVTGRKGIFNAGRNFSFKMNIPLSWSLKS